MAGFCEKYFSNIFAEEKCEMVLKFLYLSSGEKPFTFLNWIKYWVTPGNVHLNFILHIFLCVCGFVVGFYNSPNISYAQYIHQKQYNEKESLILDEQRI